MLVHLHHVLISCPVSLRVFAVPAVCLASGLPAAPANSGWPSSGCDNVYTGATCSATCAANYAGTVTTTCTDGQWGPASGQCILQGEGAHSLVMHTHRLAVNQFTQGFLPCATMDPTVHMGIWRVYQGMWRQHTLHTSKL